MRGGRERKGGRDWERERRERQRQKERWKKRKQCCSLYFKTASTCPGKPMCALPNLSAFP